jgi:hypothetical protein
MGVLKPAKVLRFGPAAPGNLYDDRSIPECRLGCQKDAGETPSSHFALKPEAEKMFARQGPGSNWSREFRLGQLIHEKVRENQPMQR